MKYPPHPVTPAEARALLEACGAGWRGQRNRALVVTLWRCGLRAFEACALELEHLERLDGGRWRVMVARPKGGRAPRVVGLDPEGGRVLGVWLERRISGLGRGRTRGPVFTTTTGKPVHPSYLRQLFPLLARRAGIERRIHPHALRHTFARELYDEGVGVREIQVALGHRSLATTEKYLQSIGATRAVEITSRRTWQT